MRFPKQFVIFLLLVSCSSFLFTSQNSCSTLDIPLSNQQVPISSQSPIRVVCSISIIGDFVANLIYNTGVFEYSTLIKGQQDPHTYEAKQTDLYSLIQADVLILFNNSDLESFWVPGEDSPNIDPPTKATVLQDNPDLVVLSITNSSMEKYDPFIGEFNSHMWMDPLNAKMMVRNLYLSLKPLITEPTNLAQFESNYLSYQDKLDQVISDLNTLKSGWAGPWKVVESHPANFYLLEYMGIQTTDVVEKKHDVEPSPADLRNVIMNMSTTQTRFILHQSDIDPKDILSIAQDPNLASLNVVIVPTAPLIGLIGYNGTPIDNYIDLIRYNIEALSHPMTPDEYQTFWSSVVSPTVDGYPIFLFLSLIAIGIISLTLSKRRKKWNEII